MIILIETHLTEKWVSNVYYVHKIDSWYTTHSIQKLIEFLHNNSKLCIYKHIKIQQLATIHTGCAKK